MTATRTPTTETLSSPPPVRRRHNAATAAAGLILVAAITLTPWLLNTGTQTETGPMPTSAAASLQQPAPVRGQASVGPKAGSIDPAYGLFCTNNPGLCTPLAPTLPNPGYLQFCWNSPALCTEPEGN